MMFSLRPALHRVLLFFWMLTTPAALAQTAPLASARIAHATRTGHPPKIDGSLSDPEWAAAPAISDFRQKEPLETEPATERTEVHILYDSTHIYIGVHCFDRDPKAIVATQLRRDLSQDLDDNFAVMIDPTLSRRNGYVFEINPLGTQRDGEVIEEQAPTQNDSIVDSSWDGLWLSAARTTNDGWTATFSIPFSTLNFGGASSGAVNWGINFRRFIRRKNEEDEWSGFHRVFGFWRVSQAGSLEGLTGVEHSRLLVIKPYALVGGQAFAGQPWEALHTGGADIKYGLTSNLIAIGTINTDFSDADVDQQQFNLTPNPIFIPEKRRFFLEDADVFNFLLWNQDLLFFTRQIGIDPVSGQEVPINAGGKIAGHVAGFDVGLMDVSTRETGPNPSANYSIARVKKPLNAGSYVGFIYTDKESGASPTLPLLGPSAPANSYNRSLGADAKVILFKNLNLRGYYAKTFTPGLDNENAAFGGRVTYANNWFNLYAGHGITEKNFNAEIGFVTRTDDQPTIVQTLFTKRMKHFLGIRDISAGPAWTDDPNTAGRRVFREFVPNLQVTWNNGASFGLAVYDTTWQLLAAPLHLYKAIAIPAGDYRYHISGFSLRSPQAHRLTATGNYNWGTYYTGTLQTGGITGEYRPNAHLDFTLNEQVESFRLPQGNFSVDLAGLGVSYAINRFLNATTFLQMDTAQTQAASVNFRIRYTYRPDSDIYFIYNAGARFQAIAAGNPENVRQQKIALKITYSWAR